MNSALTVLGSVAGAAVTSVLQRRYGVTGVMASSLVGLLGAGVGFLLPTADLPAAVFAGSFVGMTAVTVAPLGPIALAGAVAGVLCAIVNALNAFPGYGGKLGVAAFVATALVVWITGSLGVTLPVQDLPQRISKAVIRNGGLLSH